MAKDKIPPVLVGPAYNFPLPPEKKESDYLNAYSGWVYSAISIIAREMSMIELKLYKKKYTKNDIEITEVTQHEALSLLNGVNPFMTRQMFFEITQTYLDLTGEAAWAILRDGKNPAQLWPLRPDWISIKPSRTDYIEGYIYKPGGAFLTSGQAVGEVFIPRNDLIFFKYPNPINPYRGKGPVQAGSMAIDIDTFSDEWNRTFFFNSAMPSLFFTTDQKLSKAEIERFQQAWRAKFEGRQNAHKAAFLGGGLKPTPVGGNMRDLEFLKGKEYIRDEILATLHTSKANIGIIEDVNRANQEATDARFVKKVIKPRMVSLIGYLNEFYLINWPNEDLFFDFVDPTPEDVELKLKVYKSALGGDGNIPWMTVNEVRERENLEPVEGGDVIYLPQVTQGNDPNQEQDQDKPKKTITLRAKKKTEQQRIKASLNLPIPPKRLAEIRKDHIKEGLKSDLAKLVVALMEMKNPKKVDTRTEAYKVFKAKITPQEQRLKHIIVTLWEDQLKIVLSKISRYHKGLKAAKGSIHHKGVDDFLFGQNIEDTRWLNIVAPFIRHIVEEKADEIFDFLGIKRRLDTTTRTAVNYLKEDGVKFITDVNATTRDRLRKTLAEGVEKGESISQLQERVREAYTHFDSIRAESIASTEVLRATNFATTETYKQSKIVKGKEWLTAVDERVCPWCNQLDGTIIDVNDDFFKDGESLTIEGKTLKFDYGNVKHPPLHPNCRCTLIPVLNARSVENYQRKYQVEVQKAKEEEAKKQDEIQKKETELKAKEQEIEQKVKEAEAEKVTIVEKVKKETEEAKEKELSELRKIREKLRSKLY